MDRTGSLIRPNPTAVAADGPPKKRIRKSRSRGLRTKTGCLTCRSRHKKCDEQAPVCGPCSISSRDCVYGVDGELQPPAELTNRVQAASHLPRKGSEATVPSPLTRLAASSSSVTTSLTDRNGGYAAADAARPIASSGPGFPAVVSPQTRYQASRDGLQPGAVPLTDPYNYAYSPDTVASELLTADLATTRWLDLLATDAAQADPGGFSLAPSPAPEDSVSNPALDEPRNLGTTGSSGINALLNPDSAAAVASERHAWQVEQDIMLKNSEIVLFRFFAEKASLWLDLFDPFKHFGTYAVRLALRNLGLMKAILALSARYNAIVQANHGSSSVTDSNEAVQYYYETLHFVQNALQYNTYAHSEELLATALVISTYEMLDASDSNWKRHLKGVFWIQRGQDVNGASGGLRQSVWWAWLRQDIWAAFRERRRCFSFWRPVRDYHELNQDELADRAVYLLSQSVNYCAKVEPLPTTETTAKRAHHGEVLMAMLDRWKTFLGPKFQPLPAIASAPSVWPPIWIHPPQFAVAMQVYSFARILITLHRPAAAGFDGYVKTQRTLSEAVATICGIAMELKDEACQIISAQCLFGAGLCVHQDTQRESIISLINACEARTGWPMAPLRDDLRAEWAKLG